MGDALPTFSHHLKGLAVYLLGWPVLPRHDRQILVNEGPGATLEQPPEIPLLAPKTTLGGPL